MSLTNRSTYHYKLPENLIAQYPLEKRDDCRLLFLNRETGEIAHQKFADIIPHFRKGDVLVLNSSKVIPARLIGHKESGAVVEVLLLKELVLGRWECLVKPGNRLKTGAKIIFSNDFIAIITEHLPEGMRIVEFQYQGDFWQSIDSLGKMPLPPYIKRKAQQEDVTTYQTVYASERGSAAAPTAGLHFTEEILQELTDRGVVITRVVLHIGLDTFRPVKVENILDHKMHRELCTVSGETAQIINLAKSEKRRVIAVGTTSVRTLESFASQRTTGNESIQKTGSFLNHGSQWSQIFIYPGYEFQIVDGLLTNFHLPESTLLMLVSALAGYDKIMKAYQAAIKESYRFFSYGDAMLIL